MANDPKCGVATLPTRHADPETQRVYERYVAHVVAWFRYEVALDTSRLYREGRARGPQPGMAPNLHNLVQIRQTLDTALIALVTSADDYVEAFSGSKGPHAVVPPLDMLDDVLAVGGAVPCDLVMSWFRVLTLHGDAQSLLTSAFAAGRYTLHRDMVYRGSHLLR